MIAITSTRTRCSPGVLRISVCAPVALGKDPSEIPKTRPMPKVGLSDCRSNKPTYRNHVLIDPQKRTNLACSLDIPCRLGSGKPPGWVGGKIIK
jgi:hypothetical protein